MGHLSQASHSDTLDKVEETASTEFFIIDLSRPSALPCEGNISSEFGPRRLGSKHLRMHEGIDISAPVGTPIYAPANGRVVFAGVQRGYGLTVVLEHEGELTTLFGHNSKIFVKEGDVVSKGDKIAQVGNSGRSTGPHVHYEVRLSQQPKNPFDYI